MKKYIAFNIGNQTSAIGTMQEARAWAAKALDNHAKNSKVFIAEVIEVVERETPPIKTYPFVTQTPICDLEEAA